MARTPPGRECQGRNGYKPKSVVPCIPLGGSTMVWIHPLQLSGSYMESFQSVNNVEKDLSWQTPTHTGSRSSILRQSQPVAVMDLMAILSRTLSSSFGPWESLEKSDLTGETVSFWGWVWDKPGGTGNSTDVREPRVGQCRLSQAEADWVGRSGGQIHQRMTNLCLLDAPRRQLSDAQTSKRRSAWARGVESDSNQGSSPWLGFQTTAQSWQCCESIMMSKSSSDQWSQDLQELGPFQT